MRIEVSKKFVKDLNNNEELKKLAQEFNEAIKQGMQNQFLKDNPEFLQMMMKLACCKGVKVHGIDN